MNAKAFSLGLAAVVIFGALVYYRSISDAPRPATTHDWRAKSHRRIVPRLPAPPMPASGTPAEPSSAEPTQKDLVARLLHGQELKPINLERVEEYLRKNQRNAESLLAAYRATGDKALLQEALERYPKDTRVNFAGIFASQSPEERRQRLEAFKQSAPGNALANYLSAQQYFQIGQPDQAVQELAAACGKSKFQNYASDFMQNAEEAYRAAGFSDLEAKIAAIYTLPLPEMAELRRLGRNLTELSTLYRQAGDQTSATAALQMGIGLGRRLDEPNNPQCLIQDLVGVAIERPMLEAMDPSAAYDQSGRTVRDRLEELARRRDEIKALHDPATGLSGGEREGLLLALSPEDLSGYLDRIKTVGEMEALRWAAQRPAKP